MRRSVPAAAEGGGKGGHCPAWHGAVGAGLGLGFVGVPHGVNVDLIARAIVELEFAPSRAAIVAVGWRLRNWGEEVVHLCHASGHGTAEEGNGEGGWQEHPGCYVWWKEHRKIRLKDRRRSKLVVRCADWSDFFCSS